jgi:Bacterial PH domain
MGRCYPPVHAILSVVQLRDPDDTQEPPARASWRVSRRLTVFKTLGAAVFALVAVFYAGDPVRVVVALLAALVLAGYALRDIVAPVRLAADASGVTVVHGFAGQRRLAWGDIERIRVDERRRLGTRSQLLEIDTGESLHLFSAFELDAPVADVAEALAAIRGTA